MPKVYRTMFNLGNTSLAKVNEQFFQEQYENLFSIADKSCDLSLVSTSGKILSIDILTEIDLTIYKPLDVLTKDIDDKIFRVDERGNPYYEVTDFAHTYLKNDKEVIVFEKVKDWEKNVTAFISKNASNFELILPYSNNNTEDFKTFVNIAKKESSVPLYVDLLNKIRIPKNTTKEEDFAESIISLSAKQDLGDMFYSVEDINN
jgi:hypothetical protein